jgi:hypothetical protein
MQLGKGAQFIHDKIGNSARFMTRLAMVHSLFIEVLAALLILAVHMLFGQQHPSYSYFV